MRVLAAEGRAKGAGGGAWIGGRPNHQGNAQKIRVEVHGYGTSDLAVIKAIFDVATHPNVYVCWNCNDVDLKGAGLEANFDLVKDRFGDTVHIRELNVGEYPYAQLFKLFKDIRYRGWFLLEARTEPQDRVQAMAEQLRIFKQMIKG